MSSDDERPSDAVMGRFFVECQALLNDGKIGFEGIARLRNALYGSSVAPLDWSKYDDHLRLLREWRGEGGEQR